MHNETLQLPLLLPLPLNDAALPGCWSAGERMLRVGDREVWVNVWFHLFEGGEAVLSVREKDAAASRVHGRWWLEGSELVMSFGGGNVRSRFRLREDLLEWADETLLRLPDRTASLAFGVQLPYRRSHRDAPCSIART